MKSGQDIQDEFSLIKRLSSGFQSYQTQTVVPNGDDAAIYTATPGTGQIICVDTLVENIHFKRSTMSPRQIGYKSLAVNVSDLAAMGGRPTYFLVSLAVPPLGWPEKELAEIYQGIKSVADHWKMDLLGGDIVSSTAGLIITVTAIGEVDERVRLLRSNAEPGDLIFVTGYLGQSAAGLDFLLHQEERASLFTVQEYNQIVKPLIEAHQAPVPHVNQGQILGAYGSPKNKISLNDVSDGLASEAHELAVSSKVKLIIEKEKLPISAALANYAQKTGQNPYTWMFNGGEDFILVGTLPVACKAQVEKSFQEQELPFYVIGYVEEGEGEVWLEEQGERFPVGKSGYNHFI